MLTAQGQVVEPDESLVDRENPQKDLRFLLDRVDPVEYDSNHDDIVFFSTRNHPHYDYLYPLMAYRLCEEQVPTYFLFHHHLISRTFPDFKVNRVQLSNALRVQDSPHLYRSGQVGYPRYDWEYDFDEGRITASGLENFNLYPVFLATLRKQYKCYDIDFTDGEVGMRVQKGLFTCDEVLRYCQLLSAFAVKHDVDVTVVGWESNYLPNGIFKVFCGSDQNVDQRLNYVTLGTQYAHYFGNTDDFPYYIGANNYDGGLFQKSGSYVDEFEEYFQEVRSSSELRDTIETEMRDDLRNKILGSPENAVNIDEESSRKLKDKITRARREGHSVFTLFSHEFYDVPILDRGEAFEDMTDWIDRTLELFRDRDDLLILKPHPGEENRVNASLRPEMTLADYVDGKTSTENIVLLGPNDLDSIAVYQEIDCGLVWRSSVGIEMTLLGIPTIAGGNPYWLKYFSVPKPSDLPEYENLLDRVQEIEVDSETQTRAAVLLHFLKHYRHHLIPYIKNLDYSELDPREIRWDRKLLEDFFESGDRRVDAVLDELDLNDFTPEVSLHEKIFGLSSDE